MTGKEARKREAERKRREAEKKASEQFNALVLETNKVVITKRKNNGPGGPSGPAVCEYFKRGLCQRGKKCKYSHDLSTTRVAKKKAIYEEEEDPEKNETMADWDEAKLREVVNKKHGGATTTKIICKHFLKALETNKYGWFWICPGGGKECKYRHALPPGFVLPSVAKAQKEDEDEGPSLEEIIEEERKKIVDGTPVTPETFAAWKERKSADAVAKVEQSRAEKLAAFAAGKTEGLTGRELFEFNPDSFVDDANGVDFSVREDRSLIPPASSTSTATSTTSSTTTTTATTTTVADDANANATPSTDAATATTDSQEGQPDGAAPAVQASLFAAEDLDDLDSDSDDDDE